MVSKKLFSAVLTTLVILSIVGGSSVALAQTLTSTGTAKPTQNLPQTLANNSNLTNFTNLLKKANISQVLGIGNYTILAPDNAAFSKVNPSTLASWQNNTTALKEMLWYHVIPREKIQSSDFSGSGTLTTVNGLSVPYSVDGTKIKVDNATVTKADVNATNGVIHVIDSVMIPRTATATASPTVAGGFLGLPGFEALYAVAGLLVVAYLVIRRRK
jgi:PGF-CTERM protein